MQWPPPKGIPRPRFEYSRDGQQWAELVPEDLDELTRYLFTCPFTRPRVLEWFSSVNAGETVRLFPGRDFELYLRREGRL